MKKIVNIIGGLGNQMFQYAFAVALQCRFPNDEIMIDVSGFKGYPHHNGYELKRIFGVTIPEASVWKRIKLFYPVHNYKTWQMANRLLPRRKTVIYESEDMSFNPAMLHNNKSAYYLGYWQTEKYFSDFRQNIFEAFRFPPFTQNDNEKLKKLLTNRNAVSVHVRRGDYTTIKNTQGIATLDYYKSAINFSKGISPDIYLVFSDDIEWCEQNLSDCFGNTEVVYVYWNKGDESYRDMQLMSLCRHNIIANSSFSWWGAWLNQNPNKTVIAPSHWMNGNGWVDIIPDDWIKINV